jgi:hypothetical protein
MASCPLPNHCLIVQGKTSMVRLRSPVVSDRRAAQAGTEEFRRATNSRDCRTTTVSLPHGMGFSPPARKQGEPVQGTSWGWLFVGRRTACVPATGRSLILGVIVLLRLC